MSQYFPKPFRNLGGNINICDVSQYRLMIAYELEKMRY